MDSDSGEFSEHYAASTGEEHYEASISTPTNTSASEETDVEDDILPQITEESQDGERKALFRQYEEETYEMEDSIFKWPGLNFLTFRHDKIKFTFTPSDVAETSKRYLFYCTFLYKRSYSYWSLTRDTFPTDCKSTAYRLLFTKYKHSRNDDNIVDIIADLYYLLVKWSKKEEEFRKRRYSQYQLGKEIQLDSIEEEMFLTEEEIRKIHEERNKILQRMIPPNYVE